MGAPLNFGGLLASKGERTLATAEEDDRYLHGPGDRDQCGGCLPGSKLAVGGIYSSLKPSKNGTSRVRGGSVVTCNATCLDDGGKSLVPSEGSPTDRERVPGADTGPRRAGRTRVGVATPPTALAAPYHSTLTESSPEHALAYE